MIKNDEEYGVPLERIAHFQKQVAHLRQVEDKPENYRLAASGFLSELDRMNMEIREYLWSHPRQFDGALKSA